MNVERAVTTTSTWQTMSGRPVSQCTPGGGELQARVVRRDRQRGVRDEERVLVDQVDERRDVQGLVEPGGHDRVR